MAKAVPMLWSERIVLALVCGAIIAGAGTAYALGVQRASRFVVALTSQKNCSTYRHIDRADSAYFETGCAKPLPDTIRVIPSRAP